MGVLLAQILSVGQSAEGEWYRIALIGLAEKELGLFRDSSERVG